MPYHKQRPSRGGFKKRAGGFNSSNRSRGPKKAYIHHSKFIRDAKPREEVGYEPTHTFKDFGFEQLLTQNLDKKGVTIPSAIQDQAIPHALQNKDVIGIANTGTGKTIAFALPVLQKILTNRQEHALIMAPTRELAQQIDAECRELAQRSGILSAVLIGGTPMGRQLQLLRQRPRLVIGTPGRIKDHIDRRSLDLTKFSMVVLDEVDRMLDMGFVNDMRYILAKLHVDRQSFFFSATMTPTINSLIREFTHDPITISVKTGETGENIQQGVVHYDSKSEKMDKLHQLLSNEDVVKTLVFGETKRGVERLSKELLERGFKTEAIHGGKSQGQRQRALVKFKRSEANILVATDVAARGIDVVDITHVINYETPQTYEDYVHRIGRAGRAGRIGHAYTFVESTKQR